MWRWELLGRVTGLVIDHQLPAVILWPLLFVAMITLSVMFSLSFVVCPIILLLSAQVKGDLYIIFKFFGIAVSPCC